MTRRSRDGKVRERIVDGAVVDVGDWGDEPLRVVRELERRVSATRPHPPEHLTAETPERFEPDPTFAEWIRGTFIDATGPLANEEHEHLAEARLGVLWTNAIYIKGQRHVLATAELPQTMGSRWKVARFEQQLRDWFGAEIDFLLTFSIACAAKSDREFCAIIEHELYHCAQKQGEYGPMFNRLTGLPIYEIKGHDVEEHIGVVRRHGATSREVREMVAAANARPFVGDGPIEIACGVCARRAA